MNSNPWAVNDAFDVFYTDTIEVSVNDGVQTHVGSIRACCFPVDNIDPFEAEAQDSEIKLMNVLVSRECWTFSVEPKVGMKIQTQDGSKWSVSKVDDENGLYKLESRSL